MVLPSGWTKTEIVCKAAEGSCAACGLPLLTGEAAYAHPRGRVHACSPTCAREAHVAIERRRRAPMTVAEIACAMGERW